MKILVLYRGRSDHRQPVEAFMADFKRMYPDTKIEGMEVDSRDGMATASLYDITKYPSVMVMRNDGVLTQSWQGIEELPRASDVAYYAIDNF